MEVTPCRSNRTAEDPNPGVENEYKEPVALLKYKMALLFFCIDIMAIYVKIYLFIIQTKH